MKKAGVALLAALLLAGITFGAYQLSWLVRDNSTQRQAHLNRSSYEAQATYRDEVLRQMSNVAAIDSQIAQAATAAEKQTLAAQRAAVVTQACDIASRIEGETPSSIATFVAADCK